MRKQRAHVGKIHHQRVSFRRESTVLFYFLNALQVKNVGLKSQTMTGIYLPIVVLILQITAPTLTEGEKIVLVSEGGKGKSPLAAGNTQKQMEQREEVSGME